MVEAARRIHRAPNIGFLQRGEIPDFIGPSFGFQPCFTLRGQRSGFTHRRRTIMGKLLVLKLAALAAVAVSLMLPLAAIESTVAERARYRDEAVASVQASFAGPQTIVTPVVFWPYREDWETRTVSEDGKRTLVHKHSEQRHLLLFFDKTDVGGEVEVREDHYRGLHRVRTYVAQLRLSATITLPDLTAIRPEHDAGRLTWDAPRIVLGVSDLRGLRGEPTMTLDGAALKVEAGAQRAIPGTALHAIAAGARPGATHSLRIELPLAGMHNLAWVPTANLTTAAVQSNWPHAKFAGAFLPTRKMGDAQGAGAQWQVPSVAAGVQGLLKETAGREVRDARDAQIGHVAALNAFSIAFIDSIDVYRLADRATKYGALFIALVLATVFALDITRRLGLHPMQYGLVGLALAIFFLLLLAGSEHIDFALAYGIAAAACTGLIAVYMRHALGSSARSVGLAVALAVVYGAVFSILIAEHLALLMGAALLFAVLAAIMIATRKLDWTQLAPRSPAAS
jgi:inner membrane protein